jgi:hypothetical protein
MALRDPGRRVLPPVGVVMSFDREKFIKIMMLAQSPSDGEALAALRKANAMLLRERLNWEEFLAGVTPQEARHAPPGPPPRQRARKGWRSNYKGNYTRYDPSHGIFTVFKNRDGDFSWVHDGEFRGGFRTAREAMEHVDQSWAY